MQVLKRNKNIVEYSRHIFFGQTQNIHIPFFKISIMKIDDTSRHPSLRASLKLALQTGPSITAGDLTDFKGWERFRSIYQWAAPSLRMLKTISPVNIHGWRRANVRPFPVGRVKVSDEFVGLSVPWRLLGWSTAVSPNQNLTLIWMEVVSFQIVRSRFALNRSCKY